MKRARKANKQKSKKKFSFKKFFWTVVILLLVAIIGIGFIPANKLLMPLDKESGRINVLLLGTDESKLRTDSIMVASFDLETKQLSLLSIPRDTKLYVKNREMTRKITEIHALPDAKSKTNIIGPVGTAEAVMQLTGIPINYYVEFSFESVEKIFNTLGKIKYDVPDVEGKGRGMNYEDPAQDLYIHLKPGEQKLDGAQVLQLMRYRKGDSDFARMERQQNVIKAVADQKLNASLIIKLPTIFAKINKEIDTNVTASELAKYSRYVNGMTSEDIHSYQLPGESTHTGGKWYFECDLNATKKLMQEAFEVDASDITTKITITGKGTKKIDTKKVDKKSEKDEVEKEEAKTEPDEVKTKDEPIQDSAETNQPEQKNETKPKTEQKSEIKEETEETDNDVISLD